MSTRARLPKVIPDRGRLPYRLTADQVLAMVESGIVGEGEDVELWDGTLYRMVKGEYHNYIVSQVADAFRRSIPPGHHVREEKSAAFGEHSLPEPDVAICRGNKGDYLPRPPQLARLAPGRRGRPPHDPGRHGREGPPVRRGRHPGLLDRRRRRPLRPGLPQPDRERRRASYGVEAVVRVGDDLAIEVDGREVGRVGVAEILPAEDG